MRRVSLWRSTPFRVAVAVMLAAILTFGAVTMIARQIIVARVQALQDERVQALFGVVESQADTSGIFGLEDAILALLRQEGTERAAILLSDQSGRVIGGNMPHAVLPDGWVDLPGTAIGSRVGAYRFFTGPVGPLRLSVGLSNDSVTAVRETTNRALAWAAVASALIALLLGYVVGGQVHARQMDFERTIAKVAAGDLGARIPVSSRQDDLDLLSEGINATLDRLKAMVEGMQQVTTDIAHDLRTPLNRLNLRLSAALERAPDPELEAALTEARALNETFSALLRIAQIEAGARKDRFRDLDLVEIAGNVRDIYQGVAEDAGMELTVDLPAAPVAVRGDRELLTQAVVNLVENAIRHCPTGTTVRIGVAAGPRPALWVADNGPGIPAAERQKVTSRFYRLDKSRTTEGSGLGLSLVKAVAELHGAKVELLDAGPGLMVRIRFS